jgi:two-component SAPR family response regulator
MARKMLSINNNRSMNYLLKTITGVSYDVITAEDSVEAMSSLKTTGEIECILIDIDYQTEQNLNFILHLKESYLYQCPVIFLCSHKEIFDPDKLANVESVFYKPFDPLDLKKEIDGIIMRSLQK